jgi:hypothetical protein
MAARMAFSDRPQDHFLLLNGLDQSAPLVSGASYKIILE